MLRRSADRFPNKPAVICGDQTLLYKELEAKSNQLAHALLGLGLGQGAKVAILSRNLPEYAITFFGTARTGFVLNNLSGLYTAEELAYAAEKTDIEALIFDGEFSERVGELLTMTSRIKHVIGFGDTDGIDAIRFDSFISNQPVEAPKVEQHPDDPFCMTYTGGTTGRPKGVLCSHRARAATAMTSMIDQMIDERDIVAVVTPFYHIAALHLTFQPAIIAGATSVLLPKWSPEAFVEATAEHKVSVAFMVPTQATKLLSDP
ncbi:MAG TPA: class I adenylate-forming enzyme family protein, partial [Hyphomicrobiales bacterium]|nr:class I adenylate-forming enzyme family protein [Hyphomicrobiales bacterium]